MFSHRPVAYISFHSINAVGVDIAPFSAMSDEAEVLLLPGLPLVNLPGENPEPDLWNFELETPRASSVATASPPATIDYLHPGNMGLLFVSMLTLPFFLSIGF